MSRSARKHPPTLKIAHVPLDAPAVSMADRIQRHTARRANHFSLQPVRLVPTMTPFEVAHVGRRHLPALHLAVLAECHALVQQGAPVEHLLQHTTTDNTNWWVLVCVTPQAVHITALLRYRTPCMRMQAMRFDGIEKTAYHYPADVLEPLLNCSRSAAGSDERDPNKRIGQFLLANYRASLHMIGLEEAGQCTVLTTLQNRSVNGLWHKAHDLVCHYASRVTDSEMPELPGMSTVGRGG